ncbi:hypothetical protein ACFBZI_08720 [Moraxella sp. ZJ142]|uniref:hypothetical protein n=1 Tax=Moraxella marmotae TaxID=3344520 RepID=UPI0035D4802C
MSANVKCYDPATGGVLFDLSHHTTRFLGVIDDDSTSGTRYVDFGGANFFYLVGVEGVNNNIIFQDWGEFRRLGKTSPITITVGQNQFSYQKPADVPIIYGVFV